MPKSAFSANSQAKVVVEALLAELTDADLAESSYSNTCWSLISPDNSVKVGAAYKPGTEGIDVASNFISQTGEDAPMRKQNYQDSIDWYQAITTDMFG